MDWKKVVAKGVEGALVGGGATGAVTQEMLSTVIAAAIGFVFRAGRNFIKHRKKLKK